MSVAAIGASFSLALGASTLAFGIDIRGLNVSTANLNSLSLPLGIPTAENPGRRSVRIEGHVLPSAAETGGAKVVRLRLSNRVVPLALTHAPGHGRSLVLGREDSYARDLRRALITKQVRVIANEADLARIERSAESPVPIEIEGYVFGRSNPYLVIDSVSAAR
jgi:hypothetical protein